MTAPTVLLSPGAVWKFDSPAGAWRLLAFPHGNYTVRYSGFDYVTGRNGERIARRMTLQDARLAAEEDFNERVEAACRAAESAQAVAETTETMIPRSAVVQALSAAISLTTPVLSDTAKSQQKIVQTVIETVADQLKIQPDEYSQHPTEET
jgi:hypothetical protein